MLLTTSRRQECSYSVLLKFPAKVFTALEFGYMTPEPLKTIICGWGCFYFNCFWAHLILFLVLALFGEGNTGAEGGDGMVGYAEVSLSTRGRIVSFLLLFSFCAHLLCWFVCRRKVACLLFCFSWIILNRSKVLRPVCCLPRSEASKR